MVDRFKKTDKAKFYVTVDLELENLSDATCGVAAILYCCDSPHSGHNVNYKIDLVLKRLNEAHTL